jgi:hypothetical protein
VNEGVVDVDVVHTMQVTLILHLPAVWRWLVFGGKLLLARNANCHFKNRDQQLLDFKLPTSNLLPAPRLGVDGTTV